MDPLPLSSFGTDRHRTEFTQPPLLHLLYGDPPPSPTHVDFICVGSLKLEQSDNMSGHANGHVRIRGEKNGSVINRESNGRVKVRSDAKEDRLAEWKRSRRLGFMSFAIPTSIILALSTRTLGGAAHSALRSTWGWEPMQKTILYFRGDTSMTSASALGGRGLVGVPKSREVGLRVDGCVNVRVTRGGGG